MSRTVNATPRFEIRVTRPELYGPGTIGFSELSARQGHYVTGNDLMDALKNAGERFKDGEVFDVQVGKCPAIFLGRYRFVPSKNRLVRLGFVPPQCYGVEPNPDEQTRNEFLAYLRETLMPDLRASGRDATADDFAAACHFIEGASKVRIGNVVEVTG